MNNFQATFLKFTRLLNVSLSDTTALDGLESNPNEYSLLAYSEVLEKYHVETAAINIEKERLNELPLPFVGFFNRNGGAFNVVRNVTSSSVEWFDTNNGWQISDKGAFQQDWSGIAFLADVGENSGEADYYKKRVTELIRSNRTSIAFLFIVLFSVIYYLTLQGSLNSFLWLFLNFMGLGLSLAIWQESIGHSNSVSQALCNSGSKDNKCQSLLSGDGSKILGTVSYADLGFILFSTNLLILLFSQGLNNPSLGQYTQNWMSISSFLGVVFSFYSVYYQKYVAKIWCKLCLSVMGVFWLQFFAVLILGEWVVWDRAPQALLQAGLFSMLPITFLIYSKYHFQQSARAESLEKKLRKLRKNPAVVRGLFQDKKRMPDLLPDLDRVFIGEADAPIRISMVSNPLCSPCSAMHKRIDSLMHENKDISLEVLFLTNSDKENSGRKMVNALLRMPTAKREKAIKEWYSNNDRNYENWVKDKSLDSGKSESTAEDLLDEHRIWINKAGVKATPTLFINGVLMPEALKIEDIIDFDLSFLIGDVKSI